MMLKSSFTTIILILLFITVYSQKATGVLILNVVTTNAEIKIDGEKYVNGYHTLPVDSYLIEAWAPNRVFYSKKVNIAENDTVYIAFQLQFSTEYREARSLYSKEQAKAFFKKSGLIVLPITATVATGIAGLNKRNALIEEANIMKNTLIGMESDFLNIYDPQTIKNYQFVFENEKSEYDNTINEINKVERNTIILVSVFSVVSIATTIMALRIEKPTFNYNETPPPNFSYLKLKLNTTPYSSGLALIYNF